MCARDVYFGRYPAPLAGWTGTEASPAHQAATGAADEEAHTQGTQAQGGMEQPVPWSAVQFTADGKWGAALNTTASDPVKEHLTTTTLESSWVRSCVCPRVALLNMCVCTRVCASSLYSPG